MTQRGTERDPVVPALLQLQTRPIQRWGSTGRSLPHCPVPCPTTSSLQEDVAPPPPHPVPFPSCVCTWDLNRLSKHREQTAPAWARVGLSSAKHCPERRGPQLQTPSLCNGPVPWVRAHHGATSPCRGHVLVQQILAQCRAKSPYSAHRHTMGPHPRAMAIFQGQGSGHSTDQHPHAMATSLCRGYGHTMGSQHQASG